MGLGLGHALLAGLGEMQRAEQLDLQLGELVRLARVRGRVRLRVGVGVRARVSLVSLCAWSPGFQPAFLPPRRCTGLRTQPQPPLRRNLPWLICIGWSKVW